MKWVVRFFVLYGVALLITLGVAIGASSSNGSGTPGHDRMVPVSHSDYELHKSIGHVT